MKTEAVSILEGLGIPHTIRRFQATDLSAEEAARMLDAPLDRVIKTLVAFPRILVNGGMRGLQLDLEPKDLVRAAGARAADLAEDE